MSEFVILIASAKMPDGKQCNPPTIKAPLKNKNYQNNAFCLPLIGFPQNVYNIRMEKQISIAS